MGSGPITSWQIDGETVEMVTDFIFLGFRITADGDCSHEIKRCLLLGRKAMTYLDRIPKSKDITLPAKIHTVKVMVFPAVMKGCESWTIKKAKHQRTNAFKLWTARRSNQSVRTDFLRKSTLNIHWKDWSWSSNTLATWCKQPAHWERL